MIASHKAEALCCRDRSAGLQSTARCGTTVRPLELAISFKASSNLRWHKIREFGTRKDVYNRYAVEQDQIFQTFTCTGCLDVWIPGCLSPGHLHAHHFFTQTAAAPSLERKLAVAVDPQSQRAGEWNLPNSLGGFGNQVNLRSLNPELFCEISHLNKVPAQDGLHAFVSYQSEKLSAAKKTSVSLYFYLMGRVHFRTNLYYRICMTFCLLKDKALGKMLVLMLQTRFGLHLLGKNGSSTAPKSSSCVHR